MGNGTFSGRLGMIQRGEADVYTQVTSYPLGSDDFDYCDTISMSKTWIMSNYKIDTNEEPNDWMMVILSTLSPIQWSFIGLALLMFYLVLTTNLSRLFSQERHRSKYRFAGIGMLTLDPSVKKAEDLMVAVGKGKKGSRMMTMMTVLIMRGREERASQPVKKTRRRAIPPNSEKETARKELIIFFTG